MSDSNIVRNEDEFNESNAKNAEGVKRHESLSVEHFKVAVVLLNFIKLTPMDKWCKQVMSMRIGQPWNGKMPMTHTAIALELGCTEKEVIEIEEVGRVCVADYIQQCQDYDLNKKFDKTIAEGIKSNIIES